MTSELSRSGEIAMARGGAVLCALCAPVVTLSCSEALSEQAARYEARADGYLQQENFREALIEYKNAARATSDNSVIPRTLAAGTRSA